MFRKASAIVAVSMVSCVGALGALYTPEWLDSGQARAYALNPWFAPGGRGFVHYTDGTFDDFGFTLIDPWNATTAAHCVVEPGKTVQRVDMYFGTDSNNPERVVSTNSWTIHPNYNGDLRADIAILHLPNGIFAWPCAERFRGVMASGTPITHAGWGMFGIFEGAIGESDGLSRGGENVLRGLYPHDVHYRKMINDIFVTRETGAANGNSGDSVYVFVDGRWQSAGLLKGITGIAYGDYAIVLTFDNYNAWIDSSLVGPMCAADLTTSSDPSDVTYGVGDGVVDGSDFFFYLDQFSSGTVSVADLTTTSDPNDPAYGVPDGVVDASDFFYYLDLFSAGCP